MYGRLFVYFRSDRDHHRHDGICYSNEGGSDRETPQKKLVMCLCKLPLASLGTDCRQRNTYDTRTHETICVWPPLLIHVCKRRLDLAVIRQGIRVTSKMPWHIWWSPECRAGDGFWIKYKSRRARKRATRTWEKRRQEDMWLDFNGRYVFLYERISVGGDRVDTVRFS
jgi:hypothetical protein